jgi:hypothetical protein
MVKVGLKKAHTLTGISRGGGALTGAASRKAAGKKLKSAQGAAGRLTLAAKRRVPFTGVSKKAGGIKRAPRATVSTAARVAAGMWAHDKFEADGGAEGGEEYWDEEEEEEEEEEPSGSMWSGDNGVQIVDQGARSRPARAPKVIIQRGAARPARKATPAAFKITLAGGGGGGGGARARKPAVTLGSARAAPASQGNPDGVWRHDLFETSAAASTKHRSSGGRGGGGRARGGGRDGRAAGKRRGGRAGGSQAVSSRPLGERLDMALGS